MIDKMANTTVLFFIVIRVLPFIWLFYLCLLPFSNLQPPRYSWNIVESGVKHHQANNKHLICNYSCFPFLCLFVCFCLITFACPFFFSSIFLLFGFLLLYFWCLFVCCKCCFCLFLFLFCFFCFFCFFVSFFCLGFIFCFVFFFILYCLFFIFLFFNRIKFKKNTIYFLNIKYTWPIIPYIFV